MKRNLFIIALSTFFFVLLLLGVGRSPVLISPSHPVTTDENIDVDETPEEIAQKYGVTFPIAELGGCENYSECREYCEDPVNQNACIAFAKAKGFYEEEQFEQEQEIVKVAKSELGCTDRNTCMAFCQKEENFERCDSFAKKHKLEGGQTEDPGKQQILQKAQAVLECSSFQSCKSLCEQEQNREKCDNFAKQVGLRGGEHTVGPGGCTNKETCKAFCSDPNNFQICQGFSEGSGVRFIGPGGCNSEASCRTYCQENSQECGYRGGPGQNYNPQEMCLRTPSCRWDNNTCQCGFYGNPEEAKRKAEEYAKYCRENPEKCKPGQPGSFENSHEREQFEIYCRENPERCKTQQTRAYPNTYPTFGAPYPTSSYTYPTSSYNPAEECQKNVNCKWENNSCQCTSSETNPSPDPIQACQSQSGCRWESSTCKCENPTSGAGGSSATSPEEMCKKTSGCSWVDNTCKCSQVQGAATSPSSFFDYLRLLFPFLFK